MEQNRRLYRNTQNYIYMVFDKDAKIHPEENITFSIRGIGRTR